MITTSTKEQTAFRFDKEILASMKLRAKSLGRSLNSYVSFLVMEDLRKSQTFPQIIVPAELDPDIAELAGIMAEPSPEELDNDARLSAIWNR